MEHLPLPLHLLIHLVLAVLAGYFVGRLFKQTLLGVIAGLMGGFFIDLDHVLEYFLVFGPHFNLALFLEGRQFLTSGLMHLFFHAWEYVPGLLLLAFGLRRRPVVAGFIVALAFSGFIHLLSDSVINNYPIRNYSLYYRYRMGFQTERLLSPVQYQKFLETRQYLGM